MKIRLYNNDGSDYIDYEGTIEEIREDCAERIQTPGWQNGWSEVLQD